MTQIVLTEICSRDIQTEKGQNERAGKGGGETESGNRVKG